MNAGTYTHSVTITHYRSHTAQLGTTVRYTQSLAEAQAYAEHITATVPDISTLIGAVTA